MLPISECGYGAGRPYGVPDPETGQTYYGRGFVQLTWRDNYARADQELGLAAAESLEWHADTALRPPIAAAVMFTGMAKGWFCGDTLADHFNDHEDDRYNARDIINGDKAVMPSWSDGVSIGNLIEGYHEAFLAALVAAWQEDRPTQVVIETVLTLTLRLSAAGLVTVVSVESHTEAPGCRSRSVVAQDRIASRLVGLPAMTIRSGRPCRLRAQLRKRVAAGRFYRSLDQTSTLSLLSTMTRYRQPRKPRSLT